MSNGEQSQVKESQIASHWREEEFISPGADFIAQANMADTSVFDRFTMENYPEYFREYADLLTWDKYWHTTLDTSNPPFWKWFAGGKPQRLLQLRRQARCRPQEQGGLHLGGGARG